MNKEITLTRRLTSYKNKKGEEKKTTEFTLTMQGVPVRIAPVFKGDYKVLLLLAKEVK